MIYLPLIVIAATGFAAGETVARINRVADFPIYQANNTIGYIPAPNQSGSFRGRGAWAFNELSMGTPNPFHPSKDDDDDILLIGDSIVFGRVTMREEQRLGQRIAALSGKSIWPVSAGSWALQNELQYIEENPTVLNRVDRLIFILNSNDFGKPSSWRSEEHRPTKKPLSSLLYWLRGNERQRLPKPPRDMQVAPADPVFMLANMLETTKIPVDIWLYPNIDELRNSTELDDQHDLLERVVGERVRIFRAERVPGWSSSAYADRIHPNSKGQSILAKGIARSISN